MGILKLRNCTKFQLKYWRVIAFHRTNYVAAGQEGHYKWGATYTLKVQTGDGKGTNSRAAVNQNGTYYAYYRNGKVDILDKHQITGVTRNDNNPYLEKWVHPPTKTAEFDVVWTLKKSYANNTNVTQSFKFTEKWGFKDTTSQTNRLTVTESSVTGVSVNSSFEVKGLSVGAEIRNESTHTTERVTETMTETEVYGEETQELTYTLEPGDSIQVWQPVVNIFGHEMDLDHISTNKVGDGKPEWPKFDKLSLDFYNW